MLLAESSPPAAAHFSSPSSAANATGGGGVVNATQPLTQNDSPSTSSGFPADWARHVPEADRDNVLGRLVRREDPARVLTDAEKYVYVMRDGVVKLGRDRQCDYILDSTFASSHHCTIYTQDDFVFLQDTSSNGTLWNTKRVGRGRAVEISQNDTIEIKRNVVFVFEQLSPPDVGNGWEDPEFMDAVAHKYAVTRRKLGSGAFAEVRLGVCNRTKRQVAVKILFKSKMPAMRQSKIPATAAPSTSTTDFEVPVPASSSFNEEAHEREKEQRGAEGGIIPMSMASQTARYYGSNELEILCQVDHPGIVRVYDMIETSKFIYVFLQYVSGGDLFDWIKQKRVLPESEAKYIFYQVLLAFKYLHERNICHRDCKPDNLLLMKQEDFAHVLLTDFGLARVTGNRSMMKTFCGTMHYLAPEILRGHPELRDGEPASSRDPDAPLQYGKAADCWSLGVLLYVMLSGLIPFEDGPDHAYGDQGASRLYREIQQGRVPFDDPVFARVSPEAKSIITSLLQVDPRYRFTVNDALEHPWIRNKLVNLEKLFAHRILTRSGCGDALWMHDLAARQRVQVPVQQGSVVEDAMPLTAADAVAGLRNDTTLGENGRRRQAGDADEVESPQRMDKRPKI